ncbi:thiamine phosphate synthase [Clostridium sediminicola]
MKVDKKSLLLYLVTDRSWLGEDSLITHVKESLINGVTFLQLREKDLDENSFLNLALEIKDLAKEYAVPFVINDNIDIALKSNADGVHIGQDDMSIDKARKAIGEDKILGVSVGTVNEAIEAEKLGADYLGIGAVFSTDTKKDAGAVTFETLKNICQSVDIPIVAIGGINKENVSSLKGSGIDGVAVISAILAKKDIAKATCELKDICERIF